MTMQILIAGISLAVVVLITAGAVERRTAYEKPRLRQ